MLGDAEFGDNSTLRTTLHRAGLPYALGISSTLSVFVGTPTLRAPAAPAGRKGRPHTRPTLPAGIVPRTVAAEVTTWPARQWRTLTWQNAPTARLWRARFAALRVTPARVAPAPAPARGVVAGGARRRPDAAHKYYLVHLPATASVRDLVQLAHQRWAIEQQYQELKDELGFDHFEGRSLPGWQRHAALIAVAYTFLQIERQRRPSRDLTLPRVRAILQEVLTAYFFVTRPHYLQRMLKLLQISLRI